MDNKSYISTNFESGQYTLATLYDCAGDPGTQFELSPIQATKSPQNSNSTPGEYSHLSHSGPSSQNLLQADYTGHDNQQSSHSSAQLYDTAYEIPVNHQSDDAKVVTTNKSQKSGSVRQCKSSQVVMIVLLVLILLILVTLLVMIIFFHLSSKELCLCTSHDDGGTSSSSANAGLNGSFNCATTNNLTLLQNYIMSNCASEDTLLLLQNKMNSVSEQIIRHDKSTNSSTNAILQKLQTSKEINIPTAAAINDILLVVNELLELQNGSSLFNFIRPVSCKDIKAVQPNSPTGYYHVNSRNIYCNMDVLCGVEGGGWTRLAHLDMSDNTQYCPFGFEEYSDQSIRVCGNYGLGCKSIRFPTNGIAYTQICGRVVGYQAGSTDGIRSSGDINSAYLDGVSITRGSPREHVWSYIAGLRSDMASSCPCSNGTNISVPSFVRKNYYCESGSNGAPSNVYYWNDPLWDGQKCPSLEAPCCKSPNLPWFYRDYGNVTSTDYLELRVCCDEFWRNEVVPIELYEIYIK